MGGMTLDQLATALVQQDMSLGSFTEEELAVVTACGSDERLVPLPRVEGLGDASRRAALNAALRSLIARDIVEWRREDGDAVLRVHGDLATVVNIRDNPSLVVVLHRARTGEQSRRYVYGVDRVAVLEERVEGSGLHHFTLRSLPRQARELAGFVDPDKRARRSTRAPVAGEPIEAWAAAVEAGLASAETGTRLYAARFDGVGTVDEVRIAVAAGPDGVWTLSATAERTNARRESSRTLTAAMQACLEIQPDVRAA